MLSLFINWDVDPIFLQLGSVQVRYYGLTWAVGLAISAWMFYKFIKREGYSEKMYDSIFWFGILSTIIGARLGHCLFYDPIYYLSNPIRFLYMTEGGMASHGAAIGLLVGLWLFSRKWKMPYIWSLDRIGIVVAIAGALVRVGNLMNSEIYGVETALPWGFIFVRDGQSVPMHPTQIYEAICYLLLFVVMLFMYYKCDLGRRRPGVMFGLFLIALFGSRFLIEYIKNPQVAFEEGMPLVMGQILSVPFIVAGGVILWYALRKKPLEVKPISAILAESAKKNEEAKKAPIKRVPKSKRR